MITEQDYISKTGTLPSGVKGQLLSFVEDGVLRAVSVPEGYELVPLKIVDANNVEQTIQVLAKKEVV